MRPYEATVYKYLSQDGCLKTLANGSLRFSRPSALNDPFDLYLDDLFNVEIADLLKSQRATKLETLEHDPVRYALQTGIDVETVRAASQKLQSFTERERDDLRTAAEFHTENDPILNDLAEKMRKQRDELINSFQDTAVFCATTSHDNLLMWAHYAEQHRGAVLGFRPDIEKDSMLRLFEPIRYSKKRPSFYDLTEPQGMERQTTLEDAQEINKTLMLTKSVHWAYENEIRIVIPDEVPAGQDAIFLKFKPHELTEIYLGCRAEEAFAIQSISFAKKLNPSVSAFQTKLQSQSFELSFESID